MKLFRRTRRQKWLEIEPSWKARFFDMRNLAILIAILAFVALWCSLLANTKTGELKRKSEIRGNEWLAHYMEWLENQENQELKELADNCLKLSNDNTVDSFEWEIKTGIWQLSSWSFILSLMFALVRFSIGEGNKWKPAINVSAGLFFAFGGFLLVYPFLIF